MPIFVHLTSEKNSNEISDEIKKGVYCMPVLQNFMISHQCLRELKRNGQKSFIGVYFKFKGVHLNLQR